MRIRLPGADPNHNYQVLRENSRWPDHVHRALVTGATVAALRPATVADPACGDGSVLDAAYRLVPFELAYLSDISLPNIEQHSFAFPHRKQVADLGDALAALPMVDLIVLTEVLEHLPEPDAVLRLARDHGRMLIASSPESEHPTAANPEHRWSWDIPGYEQMLRDAGWAPTSFTLLSWPTGGYRFQTWTAS